MTDERSQHLPDTTIRTALTRPAPDGAAEAVWFELADRLDATPQRRRRLVVWPWSPALPGLPTARPWLAGPAIAVLVVLTLLASIAAIGLIGAAHRLPAPFGLAKAGLVAFDDGGDIYVANADGTGRRALTTGSMQDIQPTWSPDGTKIAFQSVPRPDEFTHRYVIDTQGFALINVMDADGTHLKTVGSRAVSVDVSGTASLDRYRISWSPDDRYVAFTDRVADRSEIVVARADGTGSASIGDPLLGGQDPTWSPDGTQIAFRGGVADHERGIYVMNADGSGIRRLTAAIDDPYGGTYSYFEPVWSPDGSRIAFSRIIGVTWTADGSWDLSQIWVIDVKDGSERPLSSDQASSDSPSWAPDGSRIAYLAQTRGERPQIVVVRPDGSGGIILPPRVDHVPLWSPDGHAIISRTTDGPDPYGTVVVVDIETGAAMSLRPVGIGVALTPAKTTWHGRPTGAHDGLDVGDGSWQRLAP